VHRLNPIKMVLVGILHRKSSSGGTPDEEPVSMSPTASPVSHMFNEKMPKRRSFDYMWPSGAKACSG
jgi:hypothetical protein